MGIKTKTLYAVQWLRSEVACTNTFLYIHMSGDFEGLKNECLLSVNVLKTLTEMPRGSIKLAFWLLLKLCSCCIPIHSEPLKEPFDKDLG